MRICYRCACGCGGEWMSASWPRGQLLTCACRKCCRRIWRGSCRAPPSTYRHRAVGRRARRHGWLYVCGAWLVRGRYSRVQVHPVSGARGTAATAEALWGVAAPQRNRSRPSPSGRRRSCWPRTWRPRTGGKSLLLLLLQHFATANRRRTREGLKTSLIKKKKHNQHNKK